MPQRRITIALVVLLALGMASRATSAFAQGTADAVSAQFQDLKAIVDAMRTELAASRKDAQDLRQQIDTLRAEMTTLKQNPERVERLSQDHELLAAKVYDQEQTKVESGSKYHLRLSGLALMTLATSHGSVDNLDVPVIATPTPAGDARAAFAAGVRQSFVSAEVFGPTVGGAKTSGRLAFDFFGGFPAVKDGVSSGFGRLRTAAFAMNWSRTSIVAGQDAPFFSPETPTSVASVAYPALSSAGNIWTWTPQVVVEHRLAVGTRSSLTMQGGILSALTGELPASEYTYASGAGERSGRPAEAGRVAWHGAGDYDAAVGVGVYHASQNWGFGHKVEAWAVTGDWHVPAGTRASISGELYRGRSIAGLGGGASPSVLFSQAPLPALTAVLPLSSQGGWAQLRFSASSVVDLNVAYGQDYAFGSPRNAPPATLDGSAIQRNASGFANVIYHPRSNIVLSVEYRQLWTVRFDGTKLGARVLTFVSGIGF